MRLGVLIVILSLVLAPSVISIKIFPTLTELGENYAVEQSFILTVLNDGAATQKIKLQIDPESLYLEPYVKIEPNEFTLKSNSKKNVQITTSFPKDLSPEKHKLIIQPQTDTEIGEKAMYTFTVPGIARPDLRLSKISIDQDSERFALKIELQNFGNVIARASPKIEILNGTTVVDELEYESNIMVMPFDKYNISLLYDTSSLKEGSYDLKVGFDYNDNLKTNELTEEVNIENDRQMKSGKFMGILAKIKYPAIILLIILLVFFSIKPEYLKSVIPSKKPKKRKGAPIVDQRLLKLDNKLSQMEKETQELAGMTQLFIKESNIWFSKKFGNDEYKFS